MRKNAFSLALTLWIVAIISLASVLYLSYAKKIVTKTKQLETKLQLTFEAESVVELIKFYGATGEIDGDKIINPHLSGYLKEFPKQLPINSQKTRYKNTTIILQDTAGLVDIGDIDAVVNYISSQNDKLKDKKDIIKNSITDWLDRDNFSQINGAENSFYGKYSYKARSYGYFSSVDELFLIRGLNDLNGTIKEKIVNSLILSNKIKRNILTMRFDILQDIYQISNSDLLQLKKAKEISNRSFINVFHNIYKENYNFEIDGVLPSLIIKGVVISTKDNINKNIDFLIDFSLSNNEVFSILNYKD